MTTQPAREIRALAFVVAIFLLVPVAAIGQGRTTAADESAVPRTPWGDPDLQGIWDYWTFTPLERPAGYEDRPRLTGAEAEEFLTTRRSRIRLALAAALSADFELGDGGVTESIYDAPLLDGRTSLVVSPSTGRIPRTPVGEDRAGIPSRRTVVQRDDDRGVHELIVDDEILRGLEDPGRERTPPERQRPAQHAPLVHGSVLGAFGDTSHPPRRDARPVLADRGAWDPSGRG